MQSDCSVVTSNEQSDAEHQHTLGNEQLTLGSCAATSLTLEQRRVTRMISAAASDNAPPVLARYVKAAAPYLGWTVVIAENVIWVR